MQVDRSLIPRNLFYGERLFLIVADPRSSAIMIWNDQKRDLQTRFRRNLGSRGRFRLF